VFFFGRQNLAADSASHNFFGRFSRHINSAVNSAMG